MTVTLSVFGRDYPLLLEFLPKSKLLDAIFSGKYLETNLVDLNLDPSFEDAFNWIYSRLISKEPWFQGRTFPANSFSELLQLADYLQIEDILDELRKYVLSGQVPIDILIQTYPEYSNFPALKNAALYTIIRSNTYYNNLPKFAQEYLDSQLTTNYPDDTVILAKLYPITNQHIELPNDYARVCQKYRQPIPIDLTQPINLLSWQMMANVQIDDNYHLMTCPSKHFPYVGPSNRIKELPCCFANPTPGVDYIDNALLQNKVGYMAHGGFMVFVDPTFKGDYVFSNDFQKIPEIQAIVI